MAQALRELKLMWEVWRADRQAARLNREIAREALYWRTEYQLRLVAAARAAGLAA